MKKILIHGSNGSLHIQTVVQVQDPYLGVVPVPVSVVEISRKLSVLAIESSTASVMAKTWTSKHSLRLSKPVRRTLTSEHL